MKLYPSTGIYPWLTQHDGVENIWIIRAKQGISIGRCRIVKPERRSLKVQNSCKYMQLLCNLIPWIPSSIIIHWGTLPGWEVRVSSHPHQHGLRCWRPSQSRPSKMGNKILRRGEKKSQKSEATWIYLDSMTWREIWHCECWSLIHTARLWWKSKPFA